MAHIKVFENIRYLTTRLLCQQHSLEGYCLRCGSSIVHFGIMKCLVTVQGRFCMEFGRKPEMKVSYRWFSECSYICKEQSPSIMVTENCQEVKNLWPKIKMLCIVTSALSGSSSVPYASRLRMKFVFWRWVIFRVGCNAERILNTSRQGLRIGCAFYLFMYEFPYFSIKCQHSGE